MSVDQRTLLSQRRLDTLLESSAVGNTAEKSWDELRVVDIAEAEEHLVLLAEIDVEPRVEGVAMLVQSVAAGKIVGDSSGAWIRKQIQQFDRVRVQSPGRQVIQVARRDVATAEINGTLWAAAKGIANKSRSRRRDAGYRIHCARRDCASGGWIENGSARDYAA